MSINNKGVAFDHFPKNRTIEGVRKVSDHFPKDRTIEGVRKVIAHKCSWPWTLIVASYLGMNLIAGKGCGFLPLSRLFLSLALDHLSHQVLSLSFFSLLLFIFFTRFSLSPLSLSCSSSSSLGSLSLLFLS